MCVNQRNVGREVESPKRAWECTFCIVTIASPARGLGCEICQGSLRRMICCRCGNLNYRGSIKLGTSAPRAAESVHSATVSEQLHSKPRRFSGAVPPTPSASFTLALRSAVHDLARRFAEIARSGGEQRLEMALGFGVTTHRRLQSRHRRLAPSVGVIIISSSSSSSLSSSSSSSSYLSLSASA